MSGGNSSVSSGVTHLSGGGGGDHTLLSSSSTSPPPGDPTVTLELINLIKIGHAHGVRSFLLSTDRGIDFTVTDTHYGRNPFHWVCRHTLSERDTRLMLGSMIDHIQNHPTDDFVDLTQRDGIGLTFFTLAGFCLKVSVVWPLIRSSPPLLALTQPLLPIPLHSIWQWDWEALGVEGQGYFTIADAHVIEADKATGHLAKLSWENTKPDPTEVGACVKAGANVNFKDPKAEQNLLGMFLYYGAVECVRECLSTTTAIDFTATGKYGYTALHAICVYNGEPEKVAALVHLLLDRLEHFPGVDLIDWGQKDETGKDFITYCGQCGMLSVVWPIIKQRGVLFYLSTDRDEPILIASKVYLSDWNQLTKEDQECFSVPKGFF